MTDLTKMKTAELVGLYNQCAQELGERQVRRFSDRETAERRVGEIVARAAHNRITSVPRPRSKSTDQKIREAKVTKKTAPKPGRAAQVLGLLGSVKDRTGDIGLISSRLNMTEVQARSAIDNLRRAGHRIRRVERGRFRLESEA